MPKEIVIDTNVLVHLENEGFKYHQYCISCIDCIKKSEILICFDEGFAYEESQNTSVIWQEYLEHLPLGSKGHTFLLEIFGMERTTIISKQVSQEARIFINRSQIKPADKHFLRVAFNSNSRTLLSDDEADFTTLPKGGRRRTIKKSLGVILLFSWEFNLESFVA